MTEDIENRRRKLVFRSWHRGTREMDLLIGSFAEKHVPQMGEAELEEFEEILCEPDPDLYNWITGQTPAPANKYGAVFQSLLKHRFIA